MIVILIIIINSFGKVCSSCFSSGKIHTSTIDSCDWESIRYSSITNTSTLIITTILNNEGINIIKRDSYLQYVDTLHWKQYNVIYSCTVLMTLLESSTVKYLPWISTPFCKASGSIFIYIFYSNIIIVNATFIKGGYPDLLCWRIFSYGKLIQSFTSTIIQVSVLATINDTNYSPSCDFILVVSLSSSIVPLLINGVDGNQSLIILTYLHNLLLVLFQGNMLRNYEKKSDKDADNFSFTYGNTDLTKKLISYTTNPIANGKVTEMASFSSSFEARRFTISEPMMISLKNNKTISSLVFYQGLVRYFQTVAPGKLTLLSLYFST